MNCIQHSLSPTSYLPLPASWMMAREGRASFLEERIEGAEHFDIDEVVDQTAPLPHMVPSGTKVQDHVEKVGVIPVHLC